LCDKNKIIATNQGIGYDALSRAREEKIMGVAMTGDEFREALAALGWKQADLARKVELHPNTVSGWASAGAPAWAAEYLRVMLELDRLHRAFVRPPERPKAPPPDEDAEPLPNGRAARMARQLSERGPPGEPKE
jgi:transcriptional regulator with XRE-family HTH domain